MTRTPVIDPGGGPAPTLGDLFPGTGSDIKWPEPPPSSTSNPDYGGQGVPGYGAGYTGGSSSVPIVQDKSRKPVLWNPPVHRLTKPPKIAWQGYDLTNEYYRQDKSPYGMTTFGRLGAIYTDDWMMDVGNDLFSRKYGVQFHYNPTSVSFAASAQGNIAAQTLGTDPGAIIMPGSVNVGLELYFNRIYDMSNPGSSNYPRPLSKKPEDEAYFIKTLGTQYDIEFLYRACNGDPREVRNVPYKTADFGYLSYGLVRLKLGAFEYIGIISSMSVDHILFTENMVPTFSKVSLQFSRQVTVVGDTSAYNSVGQQFTVDTSGATQ